MKHSLLAGLCVAAGALVSSATAEAGSPYMVTSDADARLGLASTRVDAVVVDSIASVRLTQVYENESPRPIEVSYVFPAATQAAVHGLDIKIGSRYIKAEIAKNKDAEKKYNKAKAKGKTAALLKEHRPNVFRMRIAHVMPGDRIEVRLRYSELIHPDAGQWELVVPSVVGPRFTGEAGEESMPATAHSASASYPYAATISVHSGADLYELNSPSHRLSPRSTGSPWVVEVDDQDGGNRDLIVRWRTGGDAIQTKLAIYPEEDGGTFAFTVHPPRKVASNEVLPREYVFVVDVSGSMGGFPLATAQSLMQSLLQTMGPTDRFNLMSFSGGSQLFKSQSVPPSSEHVAEATAWIHGHHRGGGTNLIAALDRVMKLPRDDERTTTFVVVTDGYVSAETKTYDTIAAALGRANVYAFGVGSSVNRHLIDSLARAGRGQSFVVTADKEVEATVSRFVRYVRAPILTNVEASFDGDVHDLEPKFIPDLFEGRPVTVLGRYTGASPQWASVQGQTMAGLFSERTVGVVNNDLTALPLLWARTRIAGLVDREAQGADHTKAITQLALKYGISSPHTSFIAVDSRTRNLQGDLQSVETAIPLPQGVSSAAVGSSAGVMGGLKGGTSYGYGGLGIRGTGSGGGGTAHGVGYGRGSGSIQGFGKAGRTRAPQIRRGKTVVAGEKSDGRSLGNAKVMGSVSKSQLQRVLRRMIPKVKKVYDQELKKNPGLKGKVVIRFIIARSGAVESVTVVSETIGNKRLVKALKYHTLRMRFPKPAGGGKMTVSYPFTFSPAE